ncbi:glycosyltransferase [Vibrio vulnificus]|uniref:glycosyltransferase n=1 Tax=Vibrio vulnificus TaxID=672 RepID=UPI00092B46BF|nr:glycosyltransferase [Vibrio vulnificus]EJE8693659.1 glycosyltransferase [Vibrio vulnificus]OJI49976.1 hypothetical protein VVATL9824_01276 [Vibrio vulnificus]POB21974.1 glycosyltransferase [Vibrio vulnificus]HAS8133308.1 glycosyltransferase family 1 protein [Vibrio vulnificus]
MKVLLIGEFSALHKNLKEGLCKLGHEVTVAALGDGFKKIDADINLDSQRKGIVGAIEKRINVVKKLYGCKGYDVVQIINPFSMYYIPFLTKYMVKRLKRNNNRVFLLAAGTDSYYLKYGRERLAYSPIKDYLEYDYGKGKHKYEGLMYFKYNEWLASYVDGIIPIMYDYEICYAEHENLRKCIPIPMNVDKIKFSPNNTLDKINVFHGLNRYGFKGTKYVEQAFKILEEKYPEEFNFCIDGKMPLEKYLTVMKGAHVVIDQTSSYSSGVNGIYAMAMGKVVLSGSEPESIKALSVESSPIINITPSCESIVVELENLLKDKNNFPIKAQESRKYVENYHHYERVAEKYLNEWVR